MSHYIILKDANGEEYQYFPDHGGDGRQAEGNRLFLTADLLTVEEFNKRAEKVLKHCLPIKDCPSELLDKAKEIFG